MTLLYTSPTLELSLVLDDSAPEARGIEITDGAKARLALVAPFKNERMARSWAVSFATEVRRVPSDAFVWRSDVLSMVALNALAEASDRIPGIEDTLLSLQQQNGAPRLIPLVAVHAAH